MCLNPGCWKRSSCKWVSQWVTTSILSVYAARFCCISTYTLYPGREAGCSDSGSYSTLWVFLEGATAPSLFLRPWRIIAWHSHVLPIQVFHPLKALDVFIFLSLVAFSLQTVLTAGSSWSTQDCTSSKCFWGGGSTPYGFFLLVGMAPICSYLQVSWKHSFVCLFFPLPFVWIKPGHDLHTVLTARLVTCGWLEENCLFVLEGAAGCPTGGHLFESSLRHQNQKKCCSTSFLMTKTTGTGAFGAKFGKAGSSLTREMPSPWEKQAQGVRTWGPTG